MTAEPTPRRVPWRRRIPAGRGPAAAHAAARAAYLRGDSLDMSALAAELGVGRATLYRWAGNREDVLGAVLAEATERTFRAAQHEIESRWGPPGADPNGPQGPDRVVAVIECFMRRVLAAEPLKALSQREPRLFVRLATSPGLVETRSAALIQNLVDSEVEAGRMVAPLPVPLLSQAVVRIADGPLYAHLLGGGAPRLDEAIALVAVLLGTKPPIAADDATPA